MNATEFLTAWVRMGVDAMRPHDNTSAIPDEVRQCQNAAFKTGISDTDLDAAANGDVASYLRKARNVRESAPETKIDSN